MREDRPWRRLSRNIPDHMAEKLNRCIWLAEVHQMVTCDANPSRESAWIDAFDEILTEYEVEKQGWFYGWLERALRAGEPGAEERQGKWEALCRDGFRSVLSGHTGINGPQAIHCHHIVPKGFYGPERPEEIHSKSNLATVTREEHEEIHRDWRAWVPRLAGPPWDSGG